MQKISFKLEVFEGPMDLLLSLISKHKLNIYDIEISSLLEQYLAYLDQCREQDLELAGEFLEMAARLIYIKTASLLPRPEEAQKEKQALQGALIEYALCKQAAQVLAQRYVGGKIYTRPPMEIAVSAAYARTHLPYVLLETWNAMGKKRFAPEDQARDRLQRVVTRPVVSVMSKVVYVMRKVYHDEHVYLGALYADIRERSARVALFLAVLELTKHGRIGISEDGTYLYRRTDYRRMERNTRSPLCLMLEAVLFASGEPVTLSRLAQACEAPESTVLTALKQLSAWYEKQKSALCVQQLGDSWQMCTHTAYAAVIERAMETKKAAPLSAAAMEVLTIVAYNQPVSKGFVEHVRGVDSSSVVNTLVEKELLMEAGRLDVPGKPIAYATTPHFLRCFGLQSLEELPPLPVSAAPQETAEETEETDTPTA